MIGLLGLLGWKVTVISSNFIALMLILNMAMNIHLTVRFLQIKNEFPEFTKSQAVVEASKKMFLPILYTILTTICAFMSLIFSGIKPIIDFGWMMTLGLIVSMLITFFLIPTLLNIYASEEDIIVQKIKILSLQKFLGNFSKNNSVIIFAITIFILIASVRGITKLEVENSFINYFDKDTEIYHGMKNR